MKRQDESTPPAAGRVDRQGGDGLTPAEQVRLRRLRSEIRQLQNEISLLKKVAILFAREAGSKDVD